MKKVLSIVMAVAMLMTLCVFGVSAAEGGTLTVGSAVANRGETVKLDVVLAGNPGMNAMSLEPVYDAAALELVSMTAGEGTWKNSQIADKYVWANMAGDVTDGGVVITLELKVLDTAALGDTEVTVLFDGSNNNEETPAIEVVAGKVTVDDPNAGHLTVDTVYALPGTQVDVNVVLTNNPGMNAMSLEPVYDETVLTLDKIEAGEGTWKNSQIADKYVWANMAGDVTDGGVVITLTFTVAETAVKGESTEVSVIYDGSNNEELTPEIVVVSGKVIFDEKPVPVTTAPETTEAPETTVGGDVNKPSAPATADMGIAVAAVALAATACFVATKKRK